MSKVKPVAGITTVPRFQNGDVVRDVVTNLEGIIIATTQWLNGCNRYLVQPQELKDGKPVESTSVDEQQLVIIHPVEMVTPQRGTGGGGRNDKKATQRF